MEVRAVRAEECPLPQCPKRWGRFSAAGLYKQTLRPAGHRVPPMITRRHFLKLSAGAILLPSLMLAMEGLDWRKTPFVMDTWFWQAPPDLPVLRSSTAEGGDIPAGEPDVPAQVRLVKK